MSKLSPDVAPFVPRTDKPNNASGTDDASFRAPYSNVDVRFGRAPRSTNYHPPPKNYGNNWQSGNPSAVHLSTDRPKSQRTWRTQNSCPQSESIQAPVQIQGATKKTSAEGDHLQIRMRTFGHSGFSRMRGSGNVASGESKSNARCHDADGRQTEYRVDTGEEVKSHFDRNKPGPESPNTFSANARCGATEAVPQESLDGSWTEVTKTKKKSNYSKSVRTFGRSTAEHRNDAAVPGGKTSSRTDEFADEQSRSGKSATSGKPTDMKVERHISTAKNSSRKPTVRKDEAKNTSNSIASQTVPTPPLGTAEGVPVKKKTDGQRKQAYRNKVKSLPSVRGKILTVTREFYKLATQDGPEAVHLLSKNNPEEIPFGLCDFPALGDDSEDKKLTDTFLKKCAVTESQKWDLQSDSDWSDMDPHENPPTKNLKFKEKQGKIKQPQKSTAKMDEPELRTYASSVKKEKYTTPSKDLAEPGVSSGNKAVPGKKHRALKSDAEPSRKPKAKSLIELNLVTMLNRNNPALQSFNKKHGVTLKNGKKMVKVKPVVANILDSSAPSRRRGKEREKPAKKKPTAMKKIILREREAKKLMRSAPKIQQNEQSNASPLGGITVAEDAEVAENQDEKIREIQEEKIREIQEKNTAAINMSTPAIHTRKFREYCNHMLNPEIDETVTKLIQDLIRFQDRLYQRDPIKAKMRRRMVVGLREVAKHLKLKKLKCIILAPNLEKIISDGGLDEAMGSIISSALEQEIPFVFALGRRGLGRVCLKKVPVSGVGIFNYDGSEANFKHLCILAAAAQEAYQDATRQGPTDP